MRSRTYLKSIKITKNKYFFFYLYVLFTYDYPGYRHRAAIEKGNYSECIFNLFLYRKIEYINFRIGIYDNRNLPF